MTGRIMGIAGPLLATLCALACATAPPEPTAGQPAEGEPGFQRAADAARIRGLELEVTRLRTDLAEAEQALVNVESGMLGSLSRAEAVSRVAEARIQLERGRSDLPWQAPSLAEAAEKLETAEAQLGAEHYAAAIFFASRAERIALQAQEEARLALEEGSRHISGERVNLREQPSLQAPVRAVLIAGTPVLPERGEGDWTLVRTPRGLVGWVHSSLIR